MKEEDEGKGVAKRVLLLKSEEMSPVRQSEISKTRIMKLISDDKIYTYLRITGSPLCCAIIDIV